MLMCFTCVLRPSIQRSGSPRSMASFSMSTVSSSNKVRRDSGNVKPWTHGGVATRVSKRAVPVQLPQEPDAFSPENVCWPCSKSSCIFFLRQIAPSSLFVWSVLHSVQLMRPSKYERQLQKLTLPDLGKKLKEFVLGNVPLFCGDLQKRTYFLLSS